MESSIGAPNPALQRTCLPGRVCISHLGSVHGNQAAELQRWTEWLLTPISAKDVQIRNY
jgi:hypothetical protein